ncbi:MAG: hypothetical protein JWQ87_267 [Candidatus Sulfotelmatobacter sp.]|nr:hypothetical protein [Candidatus Sulfotelmatobacter sp.]
MSHKGSPQIDSSCIQIFSMVSNELMIDSVLDPEHPHKLRLHTWDGRKTATALITRVCRHTYIPVPIVGALAAAVRFPTTSRSFGTAAKLTASIREYSSRYVRLGKEAIDILIAFALASYFVDCLPVSPILCLLGPDSEAALVLRLLGSICRRSILVSDIDTAALGTLPNKLDPTLLINQRKLPQRVMRILQASTDRRFCIARGKDQINAYGAKAFAADPEFADGMGMHVTLSPAGDALPTLMDAEEEMLTNDFQAKLLRYRMVNWRRVRDAQIDLTNFVPAMRDEVRTWLAPICDCPDLRNSVSDFLLQKSRDAEGSRVSDDECVVAEAALFFCHSEETECFFVGDLAEQVNALLAGRHEDRTLTDKKVGLLLRALGIRGRRVVQGYKISLTDDIREQIHRIAVAYQVLSVQDRVTRCSHCAAET